jgi:hypothetical protein
MPKGWPSPDEGKKIEPQPLDAEGKPVPFQDF